jgi:hypothetical protein
MAEQNDDDLYISSLTVAEIRRGLLEKPAGKRRNQLSLCFADRRDRKPFLPAAYFPSMRRQP